jgi:hypothetical protein
VTITVRDSYDNDFLFAEYIGHVMRKSRQINPPIPAWPLSPKQRMLDDSRANTFDFLSEPDP